MFYSFFAWLLLLPFALSMTDPLQLQSIDLHRLHNVDELTSDLLKTYPVIFIKNDTSIILTSFLQEKARDPTFLQELKSIFDPKKLKEKFENSKEFVQTLYSRDSNEKNKIEIFPIDGCFDNTLSDTTSLVARSYETTVLLQGALNLIATLLGFDLDAGSIARFADITEEKVTCSVKPGEKVQLHASIIRKKMRLHRQRKVTIDYETSPDGIIEYSDWEEIEGPTELELMMRSMSCVSDPKYLQC